MISMYPKAEILFPPRLIPTLKDLRGPEWSELVSSVSRLSETHPDTLAFCLMMIELDSCLNCYAGSYKFMRGCAACARQTIAQFKGSDADLLAHFQRSRAQIQAYLEGKAVPSALQLEEEIETPIEDDLEDELLDEVMSDEEDEEEMDEE